MDARKRWTILAAIAFGTLFAVGIWFRISSLETLPEQNGDESYYGVQVMRLIRGEPITFRTASGNFLNPFMVIPQIPLHLIAKPSLTLLRIPAVASGILAVILMYYLGSRAFDRTTALIAATCLATLPYTVYSSRMELEQSQQPLFGVLVLGMAFLGNAPGFFVSLAASLLVHPTDIMLFPIALPIYLMQVYRRCGDDPVKRRRLVLVSGTVALIGGAVFSVWLFRHPVVQLYLKQHKALDWARFLEGIERFLFLLYYPTSRATMKLHSWLFRGVFLIVLVVGVRRLVIERHWDRLILLGGVVAGLAVLHVVAGSAILETYATHRYAAVFVAPLVIAFACLARGFWPDVEAGREPSTLARVVPAVVLLTFSGAMLVSLKVNAYDAVAQQSSESIWTFRSESKDIYAQMLSTIRRDHAHAMHRKGAGAPIEKRFQILAQDYWNYMPLAYLASDTPEITVTELVPFESLRWPPGDDPFATHRAVLRQGLQNGAYAVQHLGAPYALGGRVIVDGVWSMFPPDTIRGWNIERPAGQPVFTVYRIETEGRGDSPRNPPASLTAKQPAETGAPAASRR
jgi:4-amino-4-deoxy-L-arabinose transferase-like glycosyltransferase